MRPPGRDLHDESGSTGPEGDPLPPSDLANSVATLVAYREAVADLLLEVAGHTGPEGAVKVVSIIDERLAEPKLAGVLSRAPGGVPAVAQRLLHDIWNFRPDERGSAIDLTTSIRIYLQSQIDGSWWGHLAPYPTHADVVHAHDLVSLDALRRRGSLRFRYRREAKGLVTRSLRAAQRRAWPHRAPSTAGMHLPYGRPEVVTWLNQLSTEFHAARAASAEPPLWVNSLVRSVEHQNHLRRLGYAAVLPSAHCAGYAADLEMSWLRRFDAHEPLQALLFERQRIGEVNVIDEGHVWHVCLSPQTAADLKRGLTAEVG